MFQDIDRILEVMENHNIVSISRLQDSVVIETEEGELTVPRLTRAEKEYVAVEYDKCFGTTPRSDEND